MIQRSSKVFPKIMCYNDCHFLCMFFFLSLCILSQFPHRVPLVLTFHSSLEEHFTASTRQDSVVAARSLVSTYHTRSLCMYTTHRLHTL